LTTGCGGLRSYDMKKLVNRAICLLVLAGFCATVWAQDSPAWPPPSLVSEQYGSAVVGGIIFGTVASIGVLVRLVPGNVNYTDSPFTPELMLIPALGYSVGATVGVCAAGDAVQAGGSGWSALAGSVVGGAVGGLLALSTRKVAWYGTSVLLAPAGARRTLVPYARPGRPARSSDTISNGRPGRANPSPGWARRRSRSVRTRPARSSTSGH